MARQQKAVLDRVYGALADPTRRAIMGMLAQGEANVGRLAERFPMSFNAVSKHVKVLERAGLIERDKRGHEQWLRLRPEPLATASSWLQRYRSFWETRLAALEALLVEEEQRRPSGGRKDGPA